MRLRLNARADCAIRAAIHAAHHYPDRRTNRQITEATGLSRNYLSQILATLVRNDLLHSAAGPAGGYTLARGPAEITLLDVIEATDGPIRHEECALVGEACDRVAQCAIHDTWARARSEFALHLEQSTLADLTAT